MEKLTTPVLTDDPTAASRKRDHIALAFQSQISDADDRFYYEPMLAPHPQRGSLPPFSFLGKTLRAPIWIGSMTGGSALAGRINENLARACKDFGIGMGLGSCRQLLYSDQYFSDFDVRKWVGDDLPLYANLGVAQVEKMIDRKETGQIRRLLDRLRADGLIIHVNPLQEWLQPEGDRFRAAPIETIQTALGFADYPIIVKEVGQGFGYESLKALLQLPLAAIEFAASGGTNFAKLELLRGDAEKRAIFGPLALIGHSAKEMTGLTNLLLIELGDRVACKEIIVSGGIRNFLDGYYYINALQTRAVYGQASAFLQYAQGAYENLFNFMQAQVAGLELATAFLRIKK